MTTQVQAAPRTTARAPRPAVSRVIAWATVPLYLAGVAAYLVLDRALGSPGLDVVEGTLLWLGFGMFAAMGALLVGQAAGATPSAG